MNLSVIVLTHNEEKMLPRCLDSIMWADEIIVVDKNSTDNTLKIAKQYGAKIIGFSGEYFDDWRNLGSYHATHDWIFYIDPDERVTDALKHEIAHAISSSLYAAYQMPRKNYWWGEEFTTLGANPDYVTRLFNKSKLLKWKGIIHESPEINGTVGTLQQQLIHLTHRDLFSGLRKSFSWTKMEARLLYQAHHPPVTWWRLAKVTMEMFIKKYFGQSGWKQGTPGFIESVVQAWNRFMVYEQLWEMQQKPSLQERYQQIDNKLP